MNEIVVGVDIGGTNTVIGLFKQDYSLISKRSIPSVDLSIKNPPTFFQSLALEIRSFVETTDLDYQLKAVGIAVPGQVNSKEGVVELATNLEWQNVRLAEGLQELLHVPVKIEHDVRSFTLGEMMNGAGQGFQNLVCLTIGTGVAIGSVVNGQLIAGAHFLAGELGHDRDRELDIPCPCGKVGCIETVVSAPGIARLAKDAVRANRDTILKNLNNDPTAQDVYEACLQGDQVANDIFQYVGKILGQKLATVVYLLNPEVIIIGGGVAAAGEILLHPIRETLEKECPFHPTVQLKLGVLGERAGLMGAASLVI